MPIIRSGFLPLITCATLCVILMAACGGSSSVLEGSIQDSYTGQPVSDVVIEVGGDEVRTNASGVYHTDQWDTDDTVRIAAEGYESIVFPLDQHPILANLSEDETIPPTVTINLALRPNRLQGTITDAYTGQPLTGVKVEALAGVETATLQEHLEEPKHDMESPFSTPTPVGGPPPPTPTPTTSEISATTVLSTTTDASGHYILNGLPEEWLLVVEKNDFAPIRTILRRTTTHDITLRPDVLRGQVTNQYTTQPVTNATVMVGPAMITVNPDGSYELTGIPADATTVDIVAEGYAPYSQPLSQTTTINATLRPDQMTATLLNQETGEHVRFATAIASRTLSETATAFSRIDNSPDGSITLNKLPEQGYVQILAPGYRKKTLEIRPGNLPTQVMLEPFYSRALYVKTSTAAYQPEKLEEFFDVADRTEINTLVIDLKSDNMADLGLIYYQSEVPLIKELGTSKDLMDIRAILAEAKRRNVYTIARIHIFAHDNLLAETKPEWAAQNALGCTPNEHRVCNGDVFYADWDIAWLDPWNRNVWDYNIQLGVEAAHLGFDEVQFDYIRFPNDAADIEHMVLSQPTDYHNPQPMYENIATFMEHAHKAINKAGAFFSVDIFGYAIWAPQAIIGQHAGMMAEHADYVCPMVYPSHFLTNEMGFANAAAHPYEIIHGSIENGQEMLAGKRALQRPWLQDFTLIWVPDHLLVEYGPAEVRAQIDATEAFTVTAGWALWSADNDYTYAALEPEQ